jgi:hypothetical protein
MPSHRLTHRAMFSSLNSRHCPLSRWFTLGVRRGLHHHQVGIQAGPAGRADDKGRGDRQIGRPDRVLRDDGRLLVVGIFSHRPQAMALRADSLPGLNMGRRLHLLPLHQYSGRASTRISLPCRIGE